MLQTVLHLLIRFVVEVFLKNVDNIHPWSRGNEIVSNVDAPQDCNVSASGCLPSSQIWVHPM